MLSWEQLAKCRQEATAMSEIVVFTNGCFDILHYGHVQYLEQARELGDRLFVGVNSDGSTRELKGPGRPLNGEADRAGVVAGLEAVTAVTVFDHPTARELVEFIRPDIYVKGGDYSADPDSPSYPIEGSAVEAYGGVVRIIPFEAGYSTSGLIQRILQVTP